MIYKNVYFRIDAGYKWGEGMDAIPKAAFYDEIKTLFERAGWVVESPIFSCSCPTVHKGESSLYCHPMEISGVLDLELIEEVKDILMNGTAFAYRNTDEYETIFDMADEDYQTYLDANREEISKEILKALKTKRSNLYYDELSAGSVLESVGKKWHIHRIQNGDNWRQANKFESELVYRLFQGMLKDGSVVEGKTKNGKAYRAAKSAA